MSGFDSFDFANNDEFRLYLENITPTPRSATAIQKLKLKWYKQNIDQNFNQEEYEQKKKEQEEKKSSQQQQQPQQSASSSSQGQAIPQQLPIKYIIEGFLKVMYFPALMLIILPGYGFYLNILAIVICLLGLFRMAGLPKFNQQYAQKIIPNEFLGNIFYLMAQFGSRGSLVFQLPIGLHFLSGACEFWLRIQLDQTQGYTVKMCSYVRQNRNKIEIYLFVYSIVGIFIGTTSLFQALLLYQNIALKSKINTNMQQAQYLIRLSYDQKFTNNASLPQGLRKIFGLIWKGYDKLMNLF